MSQANLKNNPNSSLLKEARLAKGLSLDIVHESTKIPMDALRAIEDGYSTRILTPFYYRGFIKIYAEFLGLNVNDALKEYNVEPSAIGKVANPVVTKSPLKTPAKPSLKTQPKPVSKVPSQPQGPGFFDQLPDNLRGFWTAKTRENLVRFIVVIVALFILVKIVGCIGNVIKNQPKSKASSSSQQAAKKQVVKKEEEPKKQSQDESDAKNNAASFQDNKRSYESQNNRVSLAVRALKDSWIQVKTDGKVAFQMTMKKGTMENWEAKNEIELSGKNLNNLELEVNGKNVSSLGSFNRQAKKVVITKDGLTVKK